MKHVTVHYEKYGQISLFLIFVINFVLLITTDDEAQITV